MFIQRLSHFKPVLPLSAGSRGDTQEGNNVKFLFHQHRSSGRSRVATILSGHSDTAFAEKKILLAVTHQQRPQPIICLGLTGSSASSDLISSVTPSRRKASRSQPQHPPSVPPSLHSLLSFRLDALLTHLTCETFLQPAPFTPFPHTWLISKPTTDFISTSCDLLVPLGTVTLTH